MRMETIAVTVWGKLGDAAAYGYAQWQAAIARLARVAARHTVTTGAEVLSVAIGLSTEPRMEKLLRWHGLDVPQAPESVLIAPAAGGTLVIVSGADDTGLMYALLELSGRVEDAGLPALRDVSYTRESPANRVRGVDRFIMSTRDNAWFLSDAFWDYYLARLAKHRFNRLVLITGFDTAYLSPPYPFLLEAPGYPAVQAVSLTPQARDVNLAQLRRIGGRCRALGISFILGIWQQTPFGVNPERQRCLVEGMPDRMDDFAEYCAEGIQALIRALPEVDGLQFRVNYEAGVFAGERQADARYGTHEAFWLRLIDAVADADRPVSLELRAKGLTDGMIAHALNRGVRLVIPTKYWCEHTGLPYHITIMRSEELERVEDPNRGRRYSYSTLLRKPRSHDIIYRLWNYGSTNLFVWGDPDYAARFSRTCALGDAMGFEITAPLSMKGGHAMIEGMEWPVHVDPGLRVGTWEDERYGLYYAVYGRLGYAPDAGAEVWRREIRSAFGDVGTEALETAFRAQGKILPLITAFHMPVHPSQSYWPEICTGGALFAEHNSNPHFKGITYGSTLPSDQALFMGVEDYMAQRAAGVPVEKYTPPQVAGWLWRYGELTMAQVDALDRQPGLSGSTAYRSTRLDLLMVAQLGHYHVWKIGASLRLCEYERDGRAEALAESLAMLERARACWHNLCALAEGSYHDNLAFYQALTRYPYGAWRDRLPELDKDAARLGEMLDAIHADNSAVEAAPFWTIVTPPGGMSARVPKRCIAGEALPVSLDVSDQCRLLLLGSGVTLRYRHTNQHEGAFLSMPMRDTGKAFEATIPGAYVCAEWDLLLYFTALDRERNPVIYPGLGHVEYAAPYLVVEVE